MIFQRPAIIDNIAALRLPFRFFGALYSDASPESTAAQVLLNVGMKLEVVRASVVNLPGWGIDSIKPRAVV